jgi:uncharacterized membrane protein required for colicin V production
MGADFVLLLILACGFLLGFFRGVVRQGLALAAVLLVFFGAAYLRTPLGERLAAASPQFGGEYAQMIAFAVVFIGVSLAALALVEFGGAPSRLARHPVLDDALGGVIGILLAAVAIGLLVVILDTYFLRAATVNPGEVGWLRDIHRELGGSTIARVIHDWLIRPLGWIVGPLLPADVRAVMA